MIGVDRGRIPTSCMYLPSYAQAIPHGFSRSVKVLYEYGGNLMTTRGEIAAYVFSWVVKINKPSPVELHYHQNQGSLYHFQSPAIASWLPIATKR